MWRWPGKAPSTAGTPACGISSIRSSPRPSPATPQRRRSARRQDRPYSHLGHPPSLLLVGRPQPSRLPLHPHRLSFSLRSGQNQQLTGGLHRSVRLHLRHLHINHQFRSHWNYFTICSQRSHQQRVYRCRFGGRSSRKNLQQCRRNYSIADLHYNCQHRRISHFSGWGCYSSGAPQTVRNCRISLRSQSTVCSSVG